MALPFQPPIRKRKRNVPTTQGTVRSRAANRMPQKNPDGMLPMPMPFQTGQAQGNAYGLRRRRTPGFQGGPVTGANPNTSPLQGGPTGGAPGPVVDGGSRGTNPNTLIGVEGHTPLDKQRYWAAQGYLLRNNDSDTFRYAGDDALSRYLSAARGDRGGLEGPGGRPNPDGIGIPGGGGPGPVTGGGAGAGGTGGIPGGGGPGPVTGGTGSGGGQGQAALPLDPVYMAQRKMLEDALAARLGSLAPQRAQVGANQALQEARLGTNRTMDQAYLNDQMVERGVLGGGIQNASNADLGTNYLRQFQDLGNSSAQQYGDLANMESEAQLQFAQQLADLLTQSAARSASDPYAQAGQGDGGGGRDRRRRRRNRGRR
jgi:hypothetical protein